MKTTKNYFRLKRAGLLFNRNIMALFLAVGLYLVTTSCSEDNIAEPEASFTVTSDDNRVVTITNTSTNAEKYYWSFGEKGAAISNEENPKFTYASDGTFSIVLSAVGPGGVRQISQKVTVKKIIPPGIPVPLFKISTNNLISAFQNLTNLNDAKTFSWDFGDGNTSTDSNPNYTYAAAGGYLVKLTATGPLGSAVITDSIYVTKEVKLKNGTWDEEVVQDNNRTVWRNQLLEKLADTYFVDSDYFVKASSLENHTIGGKFSANLTTNNTSTKPRRWLYQDIIVSPNASYTITFWMKQVSGANCATYVDIYKNHFDLPANIGVTANILASKTFNDGSGSSTGAWVQQSITFNTGTSSKIVFFMTNNVLATAQSYYDDFEIVKN